MTNLAPTNHRGFRLGLPTLPARRAEIQIDAYAERAISTLGDALDETRWTPPARGLVAYGDRETWLGTVIIPFTSDPFNGPHDAANGVPIGDLLAQDGQTALINEVKRTLAEQQRPVNATAILANEVIFGFLFAYAVYTLKLPDAAAITEWLLRTDDEGGVGAVYPFVVHLAALDFVDREKIETDVENSPDPWKRYLAAEVPKTQFTFADGTLEASLERLVEDFAFRRDPIAYIRRADKDLGLGITRAELDFLVKYFKQSGVELTKANRKALVSTALLQHRSSSASMLSFSDSAMAPLDFDVSYHTDTDVTTAISRNNVLCAAQLFYVMTLGDELGVFRAADLLVMRHLSVGQVDIKSPQLMRDLQDYALNDEFRDGSGRMFQRTSEQERRMFYRQVFDVGDTELVQGMVTNEEFASLWSSLMLETVRYIEKAERSERPDAFVSRTPIGRVMEDLQYNLSTHASGMAKVMAPIIYRELDFLIERVFKSPEITQQLAPHNTGSHWRVIERILEQDAGRSINITALQRKARYGHEILSAIADHDDERIADDAAFSQLVSLVEAFIVASERVENEQGSMFDTPPAPPDLVGAGVSGSSNGHNGQGDWSF